MSGVSEGIQVAVIGALGSTIALIVYSLLYMRDRRNQIRQQRFENYHRLVSDLVKGREDQKEPFLDSQIAVVYELRNYREYKEVSIRILEGLRQEWAGNSKHARLIEEISYTIERLQKNRSRQRWTDEMGQLDNREPGTMSGNSSGEPTSQDIIDELHRMQNELREAESRAESRGRIMAWLVVVSVGAGFVCASALAQSLINTLIGIGVFVVGFLGVWRRWPVGW